MAPDDLLLAARARLEAGEPAQAEVLYRQALALAPRHAPALHGLGLALQLQDRPAEALHQQTLAAEADPGFAPAYYARAFLHHRAGALEAAIADYRRVIALDPGQLDAQVNLGTALAAAGRPVEAEDCLRAVVAQVMPDAGLLERFGDCLLANRKPGEARAAFEEALRLAPRSVALWVALGEALIALGCYREARAAIERALALDPHAVPAHAKLARLAYRQGRIAQTRTHYQRVLALDPGHELARYDLALLDLLEGDFARAWPDYHAMCRKALAVRNRSAIAEPPVLPAALAGKSVLLKWEQGLGDELFFLRYAAPLKRRGARVLYRASAKIAALLRPRRGALDAVYAEGEAVPATDYALFLSALPGALARADCSPLPPPPQAARRPAAPIVRRVHWPPPPAPLPLDAASERVAAWRERLAAAGPGPYLGITWRAGAPNEPALEREGLTVLGKQVPLPALAAALRGLRATVVALQREPLPGEIDALRRGAACAVHDFTAANDDLEDALALLALLDDYVGVSNTNMHLRAGLGRAARVLVPCPPEWRWMARGGASPWFPGFCLYRQRGDGDWDGALAALRRDLERG